MILLSAISAVRDGHGLVALWRIVRLFTLSDLFFCISARRLRYEEASVSAGGMRQQTPGFLLFVVHYQC